jgi:hypothetical protein
MTPTGAARSLHLHPSLVSARTQWRLHFFVLSSLRASDLAISRKWSLISFRFLHWCIRLGQIGHPSVLVVHRKTHKAKVSELESESNSASGGG